MSRYRDQSDPSRLLDDDPSESEDRPVKAHRSPRSNRSRSDVRKSRSDGPKPSQQKPHDVSERVWGLAEQFLEQGRATFDRHLPVNRTKFAQRLSIQINHDTAAQRILQPREWDPDTRRLRRVMASPDEFEKAAQKVNDIVAEMIRVFYTNLAVEESWDSWLDQKFLDCWSELWYRADQNLEVKALVDGLAKGTVSHRPANYKMVDPEKIRARKAKRTINRYLREHPSEETSRPDLTDEQREQFNQWLAERNRTRDIVAN